MTFIENGSNLLITGIPCLNLDLTLDCGQTFRYVKSTDGFWRAPVGNRILEVKQEALSIFSKEWEEVDGIYYPYGEGSGSLLFLNMTEKEFKERWIHYFDLENDYRAICKPFQEDSALWEAYTSCYGIRVLNQEPWETLCTFLISQNNNIPRIKSITENLCRRFGDSLGDTWHSFPKPDTLASLTKEDLEPLRSGYRAAYILDGAKKVSDGTINLNYINSLSLEEAEKEIRKIKGVGPKVAQCYLLFGGEKKNAFPKDVWVKRILSELYPNGLPNCTKDVEGIAQQYLFHWRRTIFNNI